MISNLPKPIQISAALLLCCLALAPSSQSANTKSKKSNGNLLIPPPPPVVIPSGFSIHFPTQAPLEYLSESDLKRTRQDVESRFDNATQELKSLEQENDEKQKRANLFVQLLAEGVVSRREMEIAQKESNSSNQAVADQQKIVEGFKQELAQIDKQLKRFEKKSKSATSKKSTK